jgi:uncharacterized repeat protein (TIGR03803 family)
MASRATPRTGGPNASLIFDGAGDLYGTTAGGGVYGYGTVFELMPKTGGGWTERVLHSFSIHGNGGHTPYAGLAIDAAGNLYGATYQGGDLDLCNGGGCGTAFRLAPKAGGGWTETVVYTFDDRDYNDGANPQADLILDASGNLYGMTPYGGADSGGTVFEITH